MNGDCKACIKNEGLLSDTFECRSGVEQGDVISPNLFNIYINDLSAIFDDGNDISKLIDCYVHCLAYADDLVLMSLSEDVLQKKQLDKLNKYCNDWGLEVNVKKTQVMAMCSSKVEIPNKSMVFGTESLRWVQSYTYLDVLINSNGDFMSSSENVCVRGWKASFKIKSAFKNIDIDPELK